MKLLFVTPYFPPVSGSGIPRGAKFAKYLLRLGWQVQVVTFDPAAWPDRDPGLLTEVEGAVVHRVALSRLPGVEHPMLRAIPGVRRAVRRVVADFDPDVVLATTPDWHWLGVDLGRHGVPMVLDYPDPWTVLPPDFRIWRGPDKARSRIKWAVAPRLESRLLRHAAAAVFATAPIRSEYVARWPGLDPRSHVIGNGFDEEDFAGLEPAPRGARVRVAHVGSFGGPRKPETAARAVRAASDAGPMELILAGAGVEGERPELERILGDVPLLAPGWVSHQEAVQAMLDADVLWLDAMVHLRSAATGKLFEYLRAGRPIVALAHPDSPAAQLVRELEAGVVVSTEDPVACGEAIARMIRRPTPPVPPERLRPFTREHLAERLSGVLSAQRRV